MAKKSKEEYGKEHWTEYAERYEWSVGVMTRKAGERLIDVTNNLRPYNKNGNRVLDSGTGIGIVATSLAQRFPSVSIVASDISSEMLRVIDTTRFRNIETEVADACSLGRLPTESYSHILSGFMIQFLPIPHEILKDWHRALQPGGIIGLACWGDELDHIDAWKKTCTTLNPTYRPPKIHDNSAWYTIPEMQHALQGAGFEDIQSDVVRVPCAVNTTESVMEWWFEGKNPSTEGLLNDWKRDNGSLEQARELMEKIIREDYDDGKGLFVELLVVAGRKHEV